MAKLIVGLGNIGQEYYNTRHNIGFLVLEQLTQNLNLTFRFDKKFNGEITTFEHNGEKVFLLKPHTYMNLSGEAIIKLINYYHISVNDLLVIVDDLNLPLGKIRLRYQGSAGGHNGLKNIAAHLKTNEYKRLRIGIGDKNKMDQKDYVLSPFSNTEMQTLLPAIVVASNAVLDFINNVTFEKILSKYN